LSSENPADKYLLHYGANTDGTYYYPYVIFFKDEIFQEMLPEDEKRKLNNRLGLRFKKLPAPF